MRSWELCRASRVICSGQFADLQGSASALYWHTKVTNNYNRICFSVFELRRETRELLKHGVRIKLEDQPFEILAALLERPGDTVTRGELRARLWPAGTFVEFDKGLNKAVNKIRTALGDSAATPRFIETLSRRGYRFIAPVTLVEEPHAPATAGEEPRHAAPGHRAISRPHSWRRRTLWIAGSVMSLLALAVGFNAGGVRDRLLASRSVPRLQSLVVLPIENLSGDAGQEYFADGFTDDLISMLSRIGSVRVISRTSAMRYKGAKLALPAIARELRVDGVVEGSLQRAGGRTRINVALIHAATERQLWTGSYEGAVGETAQFGWRIAPVVAHQIGARLTAEAAVRPAGSRPGNARAYDAYVHGRYLWNLRKAEAIAEAIGYFEQAVREDPRFALAYSGLSDCYTVGWGANSDVALAETYARKAVALDPNLAEGHVSLGFTQLCLLHFDDAAKELKRGMELNPNYVPARHFYAIYLLTVGRPVEALAENDRALQLDPFSLPVNNMRGYILIGLRQYDRAAECLRVAAETDPQSNQPLWQLARVYWLQQKGANALATERKAASVAGAGEILRGLPDAEAALAKSGLLAACRRSVQLKEERPRGAALNIPLQYGCLQDRRKVLEWSDRLLRTNGYGMALLLKTAPEFDFMRSDPRFQDLLRRLALPL
jgi:TolB-like protein/DNA-binding winged helix-turn-helix (wHTH) protein/Flp pilus assembly protein TadD